MMIMKGIVLGAGMMGRAIAYDLSKFSEFEEILLAEKDKKTLQSAKHFLQGTGVKTIQLNAENPSQIKKRTHKGDVIISAVPYRYNYQLALLAIQVRTHFIDLGGNNTIVEKQRRLYKKAQKNNSIIIPDSGLAPGLVSILTHDVVNHLERVESVRLRVGGLPRHPQPPLHYQIVFSPYGLINEYVEDALILQNGKILQKKSMTELETLQFPKPYGTMEAFLTSGGCSTLPYTYRKTIEYLDYKTIRYPGHCEKINTLLDLGLAEEKKIYCAGHMIAPRDMLASLLLNHVPTSGEDVVLLKVLSQGTRQGKELQRDYLLIDSYDKKNHITAMMRTTGYPVAITAQMIAQGTITQPGVFCPEEIIPPDDFFAELRKRKIQVSITERSVSA
jgi:lysine 6-dehydrogenase